MVVFAECFIFYSTSPLNSSNNRFKTFDSPLYKEFKGAMTENMVLQSPRTQFEVLLRYWASTGTAEVDFLLQQGMSVFPVEVKAGKSLNGKSLGVYIQQFRPETALRYSMNNLRRDGNVLNIPLFLADWTRKLLELLSDI